MANWRRNQGGPGTMLAVCATALTIIGGSRSVQAAEITVQNDRFQSGGSAVVVGDFVAGEMAGARLTSPCDGVIVAVQVGWQAAVPGAQATLEDAINIYADGFPTPGLLLEELVGPVMTPGFINEFRFLDEAMQFPLAVPIGAGESFIVALRFANDTDVNGGSASVFRDLNGCQNMRNLLFAIPGGWLNFCIFLSGDLVIRAVIDCPQEGACCFDNGTCLNSNDFDCAQSGGTFQGDGTECTPNPCPMPLGACCFEGGGCLNASFITCNIAEGFYQGDGTTCETTECFPEGACCLIDGSCLDAVPQEDCEAMGGTFQGDAVLCSSVSCPAPVGACCLSNGACLDLSEEDCGMIPGAAWDGVGTNCIDGCNDCPADCNNDGQVDVFDLLEVLENWGACSLPCPPACDGDCNGDCSVDVFDILDVLDAWGPCP